MEQTPTPPTRAAGGPIRPSMRVYQAERTVRRRWPRVLGLTLVVVLALGAAGLGGLKLWADRAITKITTAKNADQAKAQGKLTADQVLPGNPVTAMLIGEDCRQGETSCRSDTMMLVRLDPKRKAITTLSFPRDLMVDIPGHGRGMINSAFAIGQEPLAIDTIAGLTGIRPNYLVPVDFKGFAEIVDTFGGVWIEVDRRYFHQNAPGDNASNYAEINLTPGYHHLTGRQALAFSRYRHTDSDIVRLSRQQAFIREFRKRIDAFAVARNLIDLVGVAERNVRILGATNHRPSADTLLGYARLLQAIPRENIQTITLQTSPDPVDPNRVDTTPEQVRDAVTQFLNPDTTLATRVTEQQLGAAKPAATRPAAGATTGAGSTAAASTGAASTGTAPARPPFDPATLAIEVRNGSGQSGAASDTASQLVGQGWKNVVRTADADTDYFHSAVYYQPGSGMRLAATKLAIAMGPDTDVAPLDAAKRQALQAVAPIDGRVVVVVGQTFDGTLTRPRNGEQALPDKQQAKVTRDPARDLDAWRAAARKTRMPLEMPTTFPQGYVTGDPVEQSFAPFYVYREDKIPAMHVTYHLPGTGDGSADVFGVQAIQWKSPPILEGAATTRTLNGRQVLLFYNGAHIHRIAWKIGDKAWEWVSNTLTDSLTNEQMVAVARSFKRVPG